MPDIFDSSVVKEPKHKKHTTPVKDLKNRKDKLKQSIKDNFAKENLSGAAGAFCFYPDSTNFVNKDPEEEIVLLLRRHPITNLKWILGAFFMTLIPPVVSAFPVFTNLPAGYQVIGVLMWYLITFAFVLENFLNWFYNVNIITDERIIDVDFVNLIYREVTDANLDQIQDVTVRIGGGIRTIFNYGDVVIQTAAEIPQVEFDAVPKPDIVARVLRDLRIEEEQEKHEGRVR